MCHFLSGVTLATGDISIGETVDSHESIIEAAGWGDADKRTERPGLCRWEYTPPDNDWGKPLAEWTFRVDEDSAPAWWTSEHEAAAISRAQIVLEKMILRDGIHTVTTGRVFAYGSATVTATDSATVEAHDSATVRATGSATVRATDSATVEAHDSATVRATGSATVTAYDSATVEAHHSATVEAHHSATVTAYDSATVEAHHSATVRATGSATVRATGSATVNTYGCKLVTVSDNAIEIDRRGDVVIVRGNCKREPRED